MALQGSTGGFSPPSGNFGIFRRGWPHGNVSYKSWKWRIWKSYVTQLMQGISLHCMAVTESLSYCVHHYNRLAAKTISVFGFHLRFEFLVLDFIKNDIHIDRYVVDFSTYTSQSSKIQKLFKWVTKTFHSQFFDISWSLWSSITWQTNSKIRIYLTQKSHFSYVWT